MNSITNSITHSTDTAQHLISLLLPDFDGEEIYDVNSGTFSSGSIRRTMENCRTACVISLTCKKLNNAFNECCNLLYKMPLKERAMESYAIQRMITECDNLNLLPKTKWPLSIVNHDCFCKLIEQETNETTKTVLSEHYQSRIKIWDALRDKKHEILLLEEDKGSIMDSTIFFCTAGICTNNNGQGEYYYPFAELAISFCKTIKNNNHSSHFYMIDNILFE